MTREEMDFIGSMNMCDEISNEAYQKIMTHCEEQEPCEDCISRQAVVDAIFAKPCWHNSDGSYYHSDDIRKAINSLPSVTPQPKVGEWLKNGELCKCSNCHSNVLFTAIKLYKYCYHCGAKMEVEG